jgi:peptidyl-prolyl cis-trans isomerase B (cyclophilin B)
MVNPVVTIRTSMGDIQVELFEEAAPITVKNFLRYVDEKFYNNTVFHRVIDDFMIQGGGFTSDFKEKKVHEPIRNEADNRVSNKTGTIAMARTSDVHSATAQFYINVADNNFLDYRNPTPSGFGYCVFGKVISGMEHVKKIKGVKTADQKGHQNVPVQAVEILEILRS